MVDVKTAADGTRARRRTWLTGGVLFVASAFMGLGASGVQALFPGAPFDLSTVLFCAAAVVFAVGLGRSGSVTARRPLGTGSIIALAVWLMLTGPLFAVVEFFGMLAGADLVSGDDLTTVVSTTMQVITLILAVIAVVQVGRSAVVQKPWNWAALWALLAVIAAQLLPSLLTAAMAGLDQAQMYALFSLGGLVQACSVAFLGVLAIVLALRPVPGSMAVYGSGA